MTLAQNANVQEAATRLALACSFGGDKDARVADLIDAIRSALLAEWSAGEGLEAAAEAIGFTLGYGKGTYREAAEAAAPLIRAPLVAEVETLRGERDTEARQHERLQRIYLDTSTRLSAAEARVQRLEAAHKQIRFWAEAVRAAYADDPNSTASTAAVNILAALLPEEKPIRGG